MERSSFMGDFKCPKCNQEYDEDELDSLDYDVQALVCYECWNKFTVRKEVNIRYFVDEVLDE